MRRSLPERLTLDLLSRLRTHEPPEGWREDIRRLPLVETPAAALSDGIVEVGRRAGLTLVRRSASRADWASVLARGTAPVIVVGEDAEGTTRVAVIDDIGAGSLTYRLVEGEGFTARVLM